MRQNQSSIQNYTERVSKLSSMINNPQINIEQEKTSRLDAIQNKINYLDNNINHLVDDSNTFFNKVKQQLDGIIRHLEESQDERISIEQNRIQQIKELEEEMLHRVQGEIEANRDMENRLTQLVNMRTQELVNQLAIESKQCHQSVQLVK